MTSFRRILVFSLCFAGSIDYIHAMLKTIVVVLILVSASSAAGEDFILRPSSECCDGDSNFGAGSEALLTDSAKTYGESNLDEDSHFLFKNVRAGKYDLAVSAVGYYPKKFLGIEIGKNGVFDFELVATLQPITRSAILEGQMLVRFRPALSDEDIAKRLDKWDFGVFVKTRSESGSKPKHRIDRIHEFAEVRVTYDRSRDLSDLIWTALHDPSVIECIPIYFSPRD